MAVNLPAGMFNQDYADYGKGPGQDAGAPLYKAAVTLPQPTTILSMIAAARATGTVVICNFAGSRGNWTDPVGQFLIFNQAKYQAQVLRWVTPAKGGTATQAVADAVALAITDRVLICYVMDEPNLNLFNGSIPNATVNNLCLFHKSLWLDALTVVRTPANVLESPIPAGGWTGLDYGWAQFSWRPTIHLPGPWFADQKARMNAMNLGMFVGQNWQSGGSDALWDVDQNPATPPKRVFGNQATTPGLIVDGSATTNTRWMCSPQDIKDCADAIFNDPDAPVFLWWTHDYDTFPTRDVYLPYELRSDFVAAFDYALNKFATRSSWTGWRAPKVLGGGTPPPPAVTAPYVEVTTRQINGTATYTDVPGAAIAVGTGANQMIAGHTYLVLVTGQIDINSTAFNAYCRLVKNATPFVNSECSWKNNNIARRQFYFYWTKYVAAGGETIKLQTRCETGQLIDVGADNIAMTAIDVGALPANSYFENVNASATGLTTTFQDGASVTFTPAISSNWLVLTLAHIINPSTSQRTKTRHNHSGGSAETTPEVWQEGKNNTLDQQVLCTAKVKLYDNVSQTFKEQVATTSGTTGTRDGSQVFCLNLDKFANMAFNYTDAELDYGDDTVHYVTQGQTTTLTPSADGPVLSFASHNLVAGAQGAAMYSRMQVDQVDAPDTQSADHYKAYAYDLTDVMPIQHLAIRTLTKNVGHVTDLDGSFFTPAVGRGGRERLALMVQIGAAAGANAPPVWNTISDKTVKEGAQLDFVVSATDPTTGPPDTLTYSVVGALPAGAFFDTATQRFVWVPSFFQAGVYNITLRVTDGTTPVDATFKITVEDVPSILGSTDLRNVRYDAALQSPQFGVVVRWNGQGDPLRRQGIAGIIVEMADMGRI